MRTNSDLSFCCAHANVGRGHALAGAGIIVFAENSHKNGTCYCRKGHALSLQYKYKLTDQSEFETENAAEAMDLSRIFCPIGDDLYTNSR